MDKLRVFSTFPTTSDSFKKIEKKKLKDLPLGPDGMIIRTSDEKPYKSRSEILEKLQENSATKTTLNKKVKGQKFGVGFLGAEETPANGDIAKNDPTNPMTTEKLKSMLSSGAVNFSGKEQEVLRKILGN